MVYTGPATNEGLASEIAGLTSVVLHGTPGEATFRRLEELTTERDRRAAVKPALPLADYSDVMLEADIVLLERRLVFSGADHSRYIALVTERHARAMKRGAEQAARLLYVEKMLEELAELSPDGGFTGSFEADQVDRDVDGQIIRIWGTRTPEGRTSHAPYILGEV